MLEAKTSDEKQKQADEKKQSEIDAYRRAEEKNNVARNAAYYRWKIGEDAPDFIKVGDHSQDEDKDKAGLQVGIDSKVPELAGLWELETRASKERMHNLSVVKTEDGYRASVHPSIRTDEEFGKAYDRVMDFMHFKGGKDSINFEIPNGDASPNTTTFNYERALVLLKLAAKKELDLTFGPNLERFMNTQFSVEQRRTIEELRSELNLVTAGKAMRLVNGEGTFSDQVQRIKAASEINAKAFGDALKSTNITEDEKVDLIKIEQTKIKDKLATVKAGIKEMNKHADVSKQMLQQLTNMDIHRPELVIPRNTVIEKFGSIIHKPAHSKEWIENLNKTYEKDPQQYVNRIEKIHQQLQGPSNLLSVLKNEVEALEKQDALCKTAIKDIDSTKLSSSAQEELDHIRKHNLLEGLDKKALARGEEENKVGGKVDELISKWRTANPPIDNSPTAPTIK